MTPSQTAALAQAVSIVRLGYSQKIAAQRAGVCRKRLGLRLIELAEK